MAALMRWLGFGRGKPHERAGFALYNAVVAAARDPYAYATLGAPDTLDGRFDLIGLYAALLIRRLRRDGPPGPALAQAVFDAMFSDMDINLREMGVSDLAISRRVRAMWEAFHGRARAYEAALGFSAGAAPDEDTALRSALAKNIWRGAPPPADSAAALARLARAQDAHLAAQTLSALAAGQVHFIPAAEATQ